MTVDHVHEEIQLLAIDFSTMLFETIAPMPSWRDWYLAARPDVVVRVPEDGAPGAHLAARRRALGAQVAAAPRAVPRAGRCSPTRRSSSPTATRSSVTASIATMITYSARLAMDRVDPVADRALLGGPRRGACSRACVRDRHLLPAEPLDRRALRRVHGRRRRDGRAHLRAGGPAVHTRGRARMRDFMVRNRAAVTAAFATTCPTSASTRRSAARRCVSTPTASA